MAKHAKKSSSGGDGWMQCPGKLNAEEGLPNTSSDYADEGTAAHLLGSTALEEGNIASHYIGRTVSIVVDSEGVDHALWDCMNFKDYTHRRAFVVDAEMAGHVQKYLDAVNFYVKQGYELFVEIRVPIGHLTGEEGAEGTADAVLIKNSRIVVIDLKYGAGLPVKAQGNRQLRFYALGAIEHLSLVRDFDEAILVISQPRIFDAPNSWILDVNQELMPFVDDIRKASLAADKPDAPRIPGDSQCKFCKAKATCPELSKLVTEGVGADFEDITKEDIQAVENIDDPEVLNAKMNSVSLIQEWCEALTDRVSRFLTVTGGKLKDWKAVEGAQGNRQWESEDLAEKALKKMNIPEQHRYTRKLISPTAAEKLAKDKVIGPRQWPTLEKMMVRKKGGLTFAHISDKRPPAVVTAIADDFDNLDSKPLAEDCDLI